MFEVFSNQKKLVRIKALVQLLGKGSEIITKSEPISIFKKKYELFFKKINDSKKIFV